jgi:hypothetical protein
MRDGVKLVVVEGPTSHTLQKKARNPGDLTVSTQQLDIMYEDEEMHPYLSDPHKQTFIDFK